MNHPMGPVALVELGGPDQSPHRLRDRRYLELLLPAGVRAAGWGLPEFCRPPEDPTDPSREYLAGFRKVAAGPSGPPAGRPSRKPPGNDTDFISGGGPRRLPITPPTQRTDPRFPAHARGREKHWVFLGRRAVRASGPVPEINPPVPLRVRRRRFWVGG